MPVSPHHVSYDQGLRWSKRLHKAFKQLLPNVDSTPSLMVCQAALARALGHAHWHAFEATRSSSAPGAAIPVASGPSGPDSNPGGHGDEPALPDSLRTALSTLLWRQGSTLFLESRQDQVAASSRESGEVRFWPASRQDLEAWMAWGRACTAEAGVSQGVNLVLAERRVRLLVTRLPTLTGDTVVIRIRSGLDTPAPSLDALGYPAALAHTLEQRVRQPGLIVVAGPVGGGTSTTVRALSWAAQRYHAGRMGMTNLIDQEDGPNGQDGAMAAARSWLQTAMEASTPQGVLLPLGRWPGEALDPLLVQTMLTPGPLVIGHLHAASPLGALARLVDRGLSPERLAKALPRLVVLHQQLVPRLCPHCSLPDPAVREQDPTRHAAVLARLHPAWARQAPAGSSDAWRAWGERLRWRGEGCPHCHGQGLAGRAVLVEAFVPSTLGVPLSEVATLVQRQDWTTLQQRWNERDGTPEAGAADVGQGPASRLGHGLRLLEMGAVAPDELVARTGL